jgi:hypothetical protein
MLPDAKGWIEVSILTQGQQVLPVSSLLLSVSGLSLAGFVTMFLFLVPERKESFQNGASFSLQTPACVA